jgi:hypothetical protein
MNMRADQKHSGTAPENSGLSAATERRAPGIGRVGRPSTQGAAAAPEKDWP